MKTLSTLGVVAVTLFTSSGWAAGQGGENPRPRADAHGDPLPEGAVARIGSTRLRHAGAVRGLAFSPDGALLASTSTDGAIKLWAAGGKALHTFRARQHGAEAVGFTPDGKTLVAGERRGIRLWEVATGAEIPHKGEWLPEPCYTLRVTRDGKHVLTAGRYGSLVRWDAAGGTPERVTPRSATWFHAAFSHDGRLGATAGDGESVRVVDMHTGKQVLRLKNPGKPLAAAFSPDRRYLATAHTGEKAHVWELASGSLVTTVGHRDHLLAFTPAGRSLVTAGNDRNIYVWDLVTGKERARLAAPASGASALVLSRDGKLLAAGGEYGAIKLWDAAAWKELPQPFGFDGGATPLGFLPDGNTLVLYGNTSVHFWEVARPARAGAVWPARERRRVEEVYCAPILAPDGKTFLVPDHHSGSAVRDAGRGGVLLKIPEGASDTLRPAFAPDGKALAGAVRWPPAGRGPEVVLRDAAKGAELRRFGGHKRPVGGAAFAPDGKTLASASIGDGLLILHDVATGKPLRALTFPTTRNVQERAPLAFSPTGRTVAVGDGFEAWLFDAASGRLLLRLEAAADFAFAPGGKTLVVTHLREPVATLLEVATGEPYVTLRGHEGGLLRAAFSPDGRLLATGSADGTALVWDVSPTGLPLGWRWEDENASAGLKACWDALARKDPRRARAAMGYLVARPKEAVALLGERLKPVADVAGWRLAERLDDLETGRLAVREAAFEELKRLGELAEATLRRRLTEAVGPKLRKQIEELLQPLERAEVLMPEGERLRSARAVEVLEAVGTASAREVLRGLAAGAPAAGVTRDARAALRRLDAPQ